LSYTILASEANEQLASWLFIRWMALSRNQAALAERSGAWPASSEAIAQMPSIARRTRLGPILLWIPIAQPAPVHPEWRLARSVLSDATWQLYQINIKLEDIPNLLSILDATIKDVLEHSE
jgi:maltose-binding protein MalE